MSSYEINYASLSGDEKRAAAIEDIKRYIGEENYERASAIIRRDIAAGTTDDEFRFQLAFVGVQGYPVTAWLETLRAEAN